VVWFFFWLKANRPEPLLPTENRPAKLRNCFAQVISTLSLCETDIHSKGGKSESGPDVVSHLIITMIKWIRTLNPKPSQVISTLSLCDNHIHSEGGKFLGRALQVHNLF